MKHDTSMPPPNAADDDKAQPSEAGSWLVAGLIILAVIAAAMLALLFIVFPLVDWLFPDKGSLMGLLLLVLGAELVLFTVFSACGLLAAILNAFK